MPQSEQVAKFGEQLQPLSDTGNPSTGAQPVIHTVIASADTFLRWWRERGRAAQLDGAGLATNPFKKATLSAYGRRCAAQWLRGFKAARAQAGRVRLRLLPSGQKRQSLQGK